MITARAVAVTATLLLGGAATVRAQAGSVSLLVIDDATDTAVPDVRVSILGQAREGTTDARGRFFYAAREPGRIAFVLRRLGYLPGTLMVDVTTADTARVTFAMTAAPQALSTVTIRDTIGSNSPFLNGFERRARIKAGSASYISRSDIARLHPRQVTDLMRRITSVTLDEQTLVVRSRRTLRPTIRGNGKTAFLDLADCPLRIAVDGQLRESFALNTLSPEEIHGIEVFPGPASIPAEYASMQRDAACGLIMVWTRRDR